MEAPNHYELLCVAPDADAQEIRAAYRRVVRLYHPDVAGSFGEAMTLRFNDALSVLENPLSRARYDRELRMPAMAGTASAPRSGQHAQSAPGPSNGGWTRTGTGAGAGAGAGARAGAGPGAGARTGTGPAQQSRAGTRSTGTRQAATAWDPNRFLVWMTTLATSIAVVIFATAIVFIYCYSGPLSLSTPRVLPAIIVALAWLVGAARRPAKIFVALLVIGAAVWPLALLGVGPFASIGEALPPVVLALPTVVAVAVLVARIAGPRVSALSRARPHDDSHGRHPSFHTARG